MREEMYPLVSRQTCSERYLSDSRIRLCRRTRLVNTWREFPWVPRPQLPVGHATTGSKEIIGLSPEGALRIPAACGARPVRCRHVPVLCPRMKTATAFRFGANALRELGGFQRGPRRPEA